MCFALTSPFANNHLAWLSFKSHKTAAHQPLIIGKNPGILLKECPKVALVISYRYTYNSTICLISVLEWNVYNRDNFLVRLDFTSDPPKAGSHLHSPSMWVLVPKQRPPAKRPSPLGEAHFAKGFYQRTAGPSKLTNWDVVLGWFVWTDASYQLCHENGIYGMFQMACLIKKTWYHNIYSMHSYDILFERYPGVISFKTGTAQFLGSFAGLDPPATNGGFSVFDDRNIHEFWSPTWPPIQGMLKGNHMMFSEVLVSGRLDLPKLLTCNTPQGWLCIPSFRRSPQSISTFDDPKSC